jgi:hypothetical protein
VSSGSMDFEVSCCLQPWPAYFVHGNVGAYGFLPGEPEERTTSAIDIDFLADGLLSGTFNTYYWTTTSCSSVVSERTGRATSIPILLIPHLK